MEGQGNHTFQVFGIGLTTYHIGSRHANSQAECDNVLINIMFIVIKASFHFQTHDFIAQCQQNQRMWPTALMTTEPSCCVFVPLQCDSWTIKKAERRRIDAFELWCWRRLLRIPWTARRSNQSILKETSPGCSLEGLVLRLKLQYCGHLMRRVDSLEKTLMLGGIGGRRRRG